MRVRKKVKRGLALLMVVAIIAGTFVGMHVSADGLTNGTITLGEKLQYGDAWDTEIFVDQKLAYCMEALKTVPPSGTEVVREYFKNQDVLRALYYGWKGEEQWSGFTSKAHGYVVTSRILSYYYSSYPSAAQLTAAEKNFLSFIEGKEYIKAVGFNKDKVTAKYNETKGLQITPTVKVTGTGKVTLNLPTGITLVNETKNKKYTGKVNVDAGTEIHFEAAAGYGNKWNSGKVGSKIEYSPVVVKDKNGSSALQTCVYLGEKSTSASAELTVEFEKWGQIRIEKASSNKGLTDGSSCYSLNGAVFDIYKGSNKVDTVTTNANGVATSKFLVQGTGYTIKEVSAPKGYVLFANGISVNLNDELVIKKVENEPANDPISIVLGKVDKDTNENKPQGSGSLKNAEFQYSYYDGFYSSESDLTGRNPVRTWVFKTDENGLVMFLEAFKVRGDAFYYIEKNGVKRPTVPLGTVTIQEIKAPKGYQLNDELYIRQIKSKDGTGEVIEHYNKPTVPDTVIKRDIKIIKKSKDESAIKDNPYYTFEGAIYGLYKTNGEKVQEITLTKEGTGTFKQVLYDNYYVQEIKAPKGYLLDETKYPIKDSEFDTNPIEITRTIMEQPQYGQLKLLKVDQETGKPVSQGAGLIKGATYNVKDATEKVVDTLVVDENGEALSKILPLGKYTVQERDASLGYLLDEEVYIADIKSTDQVTKVFIHDKTSREQIIRRDIEFVKISQKNMKRLANVPFKITSVTTGESHTIVTDENGQAKTASSWVPHSQNTNRGESSKDGIWFGELSALDDNKGALLFDTYVIEELRCESNQDYDLIEPFRITVSEYKLEPIDLGTLTDDPTTVIELGTTARDKLTGTNQGVAREKAQIIDTVYYENLEKGKEYTLKGILMNKATGEALLIHKKEVLAEKTFQATRTSGEIDLTFNFDASSLAGETIVVFERLYQEDAEVASHTKIDDVAQTIEFPKIQIGTKAKEKQTKMNQAHPKKKVTIIDTVTYKGVIAGENYKIKGVLMNKKTQEPLLVDGKEVRVEKRFTAEENTGEVNLEFTFDASDLKGEAIVVFERLYNHEIEVAAHTDMDDREQTIMFEDIIIGTKAKDQETGTNQTHPKKNITIVDAVSYSGLTAGKEYTFKGILMDKKTQKPLVADGREVTAEKTFKPDAASGAVELKFTFDGSAMKGKTVVVFERLYDGEIEAATHTDIEDQGQTVEFPDSRIKTKAKDKKSGKNQVCAEKSLTIVDTVTFEKLIVGKEYVIKGVLMDQGTKKPLLVNGKEVTAEKKFTPKTPSGKIELKFTFDASAMKGKTVVVFERLYDGEIEVATHTNIQDKDQSVNIVEKPETSTEKVTQSSPKTGDSNKVVLFIMLLIGALAVGVGTVVLQKRKNKKND